MTVSKFNLQLIGVPRLTAPSGQDATPRMVKTQALLAFLALAGERAIDRNTLQSLLWGDRMPQQGRDSLKKALSEIRKCFAEAPIQPLETDGGPVRLCLDLISVDALSDAPVHGDGFYAPDFLDGFDLPDDGFNRWMRSVRARLSPQASGQVMPSSVPQAYASRTKEVRVGLMPLMCRDDDREAKHLAMRVADSLSAMLRQTGVFRVFDKRGEAANAEDTDGIIDLSLTVAATTIGDDAVLGMRLNRIGDSEQIWSMEEVFHIPSIDLDRVNVSTAGALDQICDCVRRRADIFNEEHAAARAVFNAVDHIFRLSNADLGAAETALAEASEEFESSPLYAWYAYLTAFQMEKMGRANSAEIIDRAKFLSARAIELDNANPLSRALIAHVQSFVVRDMAAAQELLDPVTGSAGKHVMLADTIGLIHHYSGNYEEAKRHALLAGRLGHWNPFRFAFTTSLGMSHLMLGEFDEAITASRRALAQHPVQSTVKFEPTLRTLASAQALSGQLSDARSTLRALEKQTGVRTLDVLTNDEDSPYPNTEVLLTIREGLQKIDA